MLSRLLGCGWLALALCWPGARAMDGTPTPLAFKDFYKRPIGPAGLEASERLRALDGASVRLTGFVVRGEGANALPLILAPQPVTLGDEDESLADDLPPSVAYLQVDDDAMAQALRRCPAAVDVIGSLLLGPRREADERISYVRIVARSARCRAAAP